MKVENVSIKFATIHILDTNNEEPALSDILLDMEDDQLLLYLENHIAKCCKSEDNKICTFKSENSLFIREIKKIKDSESFIDATKLLAKNLFRIMKDNSISGNLIFCLFECEEGVFFGFLKTNYKETFVHNVEKINQNIKASILMQKTSLPMDGQKIDEFVFIDIEDFSINLQEKKIAIDGAKAFYLSELFLQCTLNISEKEKFDTIFKIVDTMNKKYFDNELEQKIMLKKTLMKEYSENGEIIPIKFAQTMFSGDLTLQEEFLAKIKEKGILDNIIFPSENTVIKKTQRQVLVADTGLEINIPIGVFGDIDIKTNIDGTISILLKDINSLKCK